MVGKRLHSVQFFFTIFFSPLVCPQVALTKKAPKKYLAWLKEHDQEIADDLPDNVASFKGVNVTKFLLEEASEDTMERLLNVSKTINCPRVRTVLLWRWLR